MDLRNRLNKIFRSGQSNAGKGGVDVHVYGMDGRTSRVSVQSPIEAMALPTVYRCVDILSGTIASMPLFVKRRSGNSKLFEVFEDCALSDLFSGYANSSMSFYTLMTNAVAQIYLYGNAYIYPVFYKNEVSKLLLLDRGTVSYDRVKNTYRIYDVYNGIRGEFRPESIIHLKNRSLDGGYTGMSTIEYAARTLSLSATADEQTLRELSRGNRQRGFLTGGDPVIGMGVQKDAVIDGVASRMEAEINADRSVIRVPGSMDFKAMSITPADAQLLETRKYTPFDICRFFGVHPDMVFVPQTTNYKASANSQDAFYQQTLNPILTQIETEFRCKLIDRSVRRNYKIEFDISKLFSFNLESKSQYFKTSVESGVLTPNEIRIKEGLRPLEGGDVAFISCNVTPLIQPNVPNRLNANKQNDE